MGLRGRVLLLALCVALLSSAAALAAQTRLRAVSFDLTRQSLTHQQLRSLLLYLEPDVVGLHGYRHESPDLPGPGALAALARSLRMYYHFEPVVPGSNVGSALLSRFPLTKASPLSSSSATRVPGMRADLTVAGNRLRLALVRPDSPAASRAASEVVAKLTRESSRRQVIVMASFDPGSAMGAVKAWGEAGLQDASVALRKAEPTYPAAAPKERLDFMLVSANLRPYLRGVRVVREAKQRTPAERLPLELTITY